MGPLGLTPDEAVPHPLVHNDIYIAGAGVIVFAARRTELVN